MAAITYPSVSEQDPAVAARGASARAAAVRSRSVGRRPALFSGDGQLRRPAPPVRFTSVPLVAHDDLAPRPSSLRLAAVAEPVRTARPAGSTTAPVRRPSSAPARPAGSATAPGRRLSAATYRRRRAAVAAALVLGILLAGSWVPGALGGGSLAASERTSSSTAAAVSELPMQPVSRSTYVVRRGDTLWSIARALQPEGDVRPVVDALAAARQGRPLEVGETIVLP